MKKHSHYYELTEDCDVGKEVGAFKIRKWKGVDHYAIEDKVEGETWIYTIDKKDILGKRVAFYFHNPEKKRIIKPINNYRIKFNIEV